VSPGVSTGRIVAGRYRIVAPIGSGGHGVVDLAEDLLNGGRRVALKRLEGIVGAGDPEPAAAHLRWFRHPRWAEILDEGRLDAHGQFQVVRYVDGKSLDHVPLPLPTDEVLAFLEDGARVLGALHARGLIHYDVTPGNVLREVRPDGAVVFTLTDGGLANLGPVRGIARGSVMYMAPEVSDGQPHDHRVDLYALGLVAFRLATGRNPWEGGAGEVLGGRRREAAPSVRAHRPDADPRLERIVAALLERDPERRVADAHALLGLLTEAGRVSAAQPLEGECYAAASGGFLVGRDAEVARFRAACRTIVGGTVPGTGAESGASVLGTPAAHHDNVLIVHGPSGSGGTRLTSEYAAIARAEGIALLSLSGRGGAADRRSPLRRLTDGITLLTGLADASAASGRADARPGREDLAAGDDVRMTERLVALCDRAAENTPLVLIIEDFPELPEASQEGVRVLARHLLARSEHPDGRAPARLLVVVDHGPAEPAAFLLPDAADPQRPVQELAPLTAAQIGLLAADRYVGLEPTPEDLEAVRSVTDGLPRLVVSVLSLARERGDLARDHGLWIWNASRTSSYDLDRNVSPAIRRAYDALSPAAREVADYLALLEVPVPEEYLRQLCTPAAIAEFAASPLASASTDSSAQRLALSGSVARVVLSRTADPSPRIELLARTSTTPLPDLAVETIRLRIGSTDADALLADLETVAGGLSASARRRGLEVAERLLPLVRNPRATDPHWTGLLSLAAVDSNAGALFAFLSRRALHEDPGSPRACLQLAELALRARSAHIAQSLASRALQLASDSDDRVAAAGASVLLVRSLTVGATTELGRGARQNALAAVRKLPVGIRRTLPDLLVQLALASSRHSATTGAHARAVAKATRAYRRARASGRLSLAASALNNRALSFWALGRPDEAVASVSRAIRIRLASGDLSGACAGLQNLGVALAFKNAHTAAAAAHSRAYGIAVRHGHFDIASAALVSIASIQDRFGSPSLAVATLHRVLRMPGTAAAASMRSVAQARVAELGWHIAPSRHLSKPRQAIRRLGLAPSHTRTLVDAIALALGAPGPCARGTRGCSGSPLDDGPELRKIVRLASSCRRLATTSRSRSLPRERRGALDTLLASVPAMAGGPALHDTRPTPTAEQFLAGFAELTSVHASVSGPTQRAVVGLVLASLSDSGRCTEQAGEILEALLRVAQRRGWHLLAARLAARIALRSVAGGGTKDASRLLTTCLTAFEAPAEAASPNDGHGAPNLPGEIALVARALGLVTAPKTRPSRRLSLLERLHAYAHRNGPAAVASTPDRRREDALRAMLQFAADTKATPALDPLLDSLTRFARSITGAEHAHVVLLDGEDASQFRVASSATTGDVGPRRDTLSHTVLRRVLRDRRPLLLHDIYGDSDLVQRPSVVALALRSVLCVPLVRGGTLYGAMYADSTEGAGSFDQTDLDVLTLFADQAAAAIANSRLLASAQASLENFRSAQDRLLKGERLRAMGEMTSGVAHEFNNLLTAILARLQLMALEPLPGEIRDHCLVERAALDAADVVRRLQTFTKTQRQGSHAILDVGEACRDAVEYLRPLWASRRRHARPAVHVRVRTAPDCLVRGEASEIREVLTNLVKNSLEALEDGGTIDVECARLGEYIEVQVRDSGPGIPEATLQRLFTPFFTTKGERGTGLGLCLCQQIVERHSGTLGIKSAAGVGTTASFRLPAAAREQTYDRREVGNRTRSKPSLLVVDDDPNVLKPLCDYLERQGYPVTSASNGRDALVEVANRSPAIILTDVAMPFIDGIELCSRTRSTSPNTRVILMSGQASGIDSAAVRQAGAEALVAKPFTMRQILEVIESTNARPGTPLST
jgi:signal transduction histidine kinase/ActR/RegA family two-component response regulator/tetratricopeptide (TPR) repeat protein